jgi:short-subunit dehydrogenase
VPTEFQARAGIAGDSYPSLLTESAQAVAEQGYRAVKDGRRMVVPGFANKVVTVLAPLLPRGLVLAALQRRNRRRR